MKANYHSHLTMWMWFFIFTCFLTESIAISSQDQLAIRNGSPNRVAFRDAQLEKAVERTLGKHDPNQGDMLLLDQLDVAYESIQSLEGLEYALNLKRLDISYNDIALIKPICKIEGLEELNISGCQLEDIAMLSHLNRLKRLRARNCGLTDISFLGNFKYLYHLDLTDNFISDIEILHTHEHLGILAMENNTVTDIAALSGLSDLRELMLGGNQIEDISFLLNLSGLEHLTLHDNRIREISSLSGLSHLSLLSLSGNPLTDQSVNTILPEIWKQNRDNFPPITIYFDGEEYDPGTGSHEKNFVFSHAASLSPGGDYLLLSAGPAKDHHVSGLEAGSRVFLLSVNEEKHAKIHAVPSVVAGSLGGMAGSIGWRNEQEFHVLTDMGKGGYYRLFVYSVQKENNELTIDLKCSQTNAPYVIGIKWSPDGRYVSGHMLGWGKRTAVFDYEQKIIRSYELPIASRYCWADQKTLFSCLDNQIIRTQLDGIAETHQRVMGRAEREACIGGAIQKKPVYALDNGIYWGKEQLYSAANDIEELFVGQTQVAYVCNDIVGVINLDGREIFSKTLTAKDRILAFSENQNALYFLTNDRTTIEFCDILHNGAMSVLCRADEIKTVKGKGN